MSFFQRSSSRFPITRSGSEPLYSLTYNQRRAAESPLGPSAYYRTVWPLHPLLCLAALR